MQEVLHLPIIRRQDVGWAQRIENMLMQVLCYPLIPEIFPALLKCQALKSATLGLTHQLLAVWLPFCWKDLAMKETVTKLDRIVEQFGAQIVHGTYLPGSALPSETELCKTFEISRATLREVVKVLGAKKLIDVQKHKGLLVMPKEKWNYLDTDVLRWVLSVEENHEFIHILLETRSVIEPAIAEWAAQRATAVDLVEMETALNDMDRFYEDKNAFNLADIQFHRALIASAHNYVIEQLGEAISTLQRAVFDVTYFSDNTTREVTISQHRKLYDAVRLKNPKVARKMSMVMIAGVEKRISEKYKKKT